MFTTMTTCPECSKSYESIISLSIHYRHTHSKSSEDLYLALYLKKVVPTCKCGCGVSVKFLGIARGYREYQRGHASRVNNNWGHNQEALLKSQEVRRENWRNGTYIPWNQGLTKETDERVADYGSKGSVTILSNQQERARRSKNMKARRTNGTIVDLTKENHSQWKGGISPLNHFCHANRNLYNNWKYPKLRAADFKCIVCGCGNHIEVHHNKETFSEILREQAALAGWDENFAVSLESNNQQLISLKDKISEAVADYHIKNNVSGIVLCEECHKEEHSKYND